MNGFETAGLTGNITDEPTLRFSPEGRPVVTFGLAVNRRFRRGDEWDEDTVFTRVEAWGDIAENAAESFAVGDRIMLNGYVKIHDWVGKDGKNRRDVVIVADEIGASVRWARTTITKDPRSERPLASTPPNSAPAPTAAAPSEPPATTGAEPVPF